MKTLPVFLKNNVVYEFYSTDSGSEKLVLQHLICDDEKTFDISRCTVYVNDTAVNFIKGDWTNPNVFHVNGMQNKTASLRIEPFSILKFMLKVNCTEQLENNLENIRFQLHLVLEKETISLTA